MTSEQRASLPPGVVETLVAYDLVVAERDRLLAGYKDTLNHDIDELWNIISTLPWTDTQEAIGYNWGAAAMEIENIRKLIGKYPREQFYVTTCVERSLNCGKYTTVALELYSSEKMLALCPIIDILARGDMPQVWRTLSGMSLPTGGDLYSKLPEIFHDLPNVTVVPEFVLEFYDLMRKEGLLSSSGQRTPSTSAQIAAQSAEAVVIQNT